MELIDEAHLHAAHAGLLVVGEPAAIDAVDEHLAAVGALQQPGDVKQGRLAGAGRPEQSDGFSREERCRRPLQDVDAAVALGIGSLEPLKAKHW